MTANVSLVQQTSSCRYIRRNSDKPSRLSLNHTLNIYRAQSSHHNHQVCRSTYNSENGGFSFRSDFFGHLRQISTFSDHLVIPSACIYMVLHACHDHAMSGGHLAYKHKFDKVRDKFWLPTLHHGVKPRGVMTAKHTNGVNHRIGGPSYL